MSNNLIEIKNLNKDFIDETGFKKHVLEDVSLNIEKGKITSILAPKGSGKSTLLKVIAGLEPGPAEVSVHEEKSIIYLPSKASSFPWQHTHQTRR